MVDTANALRIWVFFEDVLLELLKKQRIAVIILKKRLTLVHGILPSRVKYLCRSLLLTALNSQFPSNLNQASVAFLPNGLPSGASSCRHVTPTLRTAVSHHHRFRDFLGYAFNFSPFV